jgi:2-polyprenyl-6-methoxyphenol hydroxylase-like FAD-dependent oxidoreductase
MVGFRRLEEALMTSTDVVVVGAGPTGLALACEVALAGARCRLLERRAEQPNMTRAFAVHARTLELLDARGLADDLVARGVVVQELQPAPGATIDLRTLDTRYPMVLIAPQSVTETLLEQRARELGVEFVRGAEVTGLREDADGVVVDLSDGRTASAQYAVGCDGAHSTVRRLLGIDFVGHQYETHILLADVRLADPPERAMFATTSAEGAVIVVPFGGGWFRAIAWDRLREQVPLDVPVPVTEMRDAFRRIAGTDFGMDEQRWSSRFRSERRQARAYRAGRVFLAGDAAHVHSPLGGQGMNTGVQDAMNLGWRLGAALAGRTTLLDGYETERHPVGERVLELTDNFNRLVLGRSALHRAIQTRLIRLIVRFPPARARITGRMTGLTIGYPRGKGDHPWVGRRMPDVPGPGGRLYEALREGRFVLVAATGAVAELAGGSLRTLRAADPGAPGLPAATLVRPDGYVAWAGPAGEGVAEHARAAVAQWCGPAPDRRETTDWMRGGRQ